MSFALQAKPSFKGRACPQEKSSKRTQPLLKDKIAENLPTPPPARLKKGTLCGGDKWKFYFVSLFALSIYPLFEEHSLLQGALHNR